MVDADISDRTDIAPFDVMTNTFKYNYPTCKLAPRFVRAALGLPHSTPTEALLCRQTTTSNTAYLKVDDKKVVFVDDEAWLGISAPIGPEAFYLSYTLGRGISNEQHWHLSTRQVLTQEFTTEQAFNWTELQWLGDGDSHIFTVQSGVFFDTDHPIYTLVLDHDTGLAGVADLPPNSTAAAPRSTNFNRIFLWYKVHRTSSDYRDGVWPGVRYWGREGGGNEKVYFYHYRLETTIIGTNGEIKWTTSIEDWPTQLVKPDFGKELDVPVHSSVHWAAMPYFKCLTIDTDTLEASTSLDNLGQILEIKFKMGVPRYYIDTPGDGDRYEPKLTDATTLKVRIEDVYIVAPRNNEFKVWYGTPDQYLDMGPGGGSMPIVSFGGREQ